MAGGDTMAVPRPRKLHRMIKIMGEGEKAARREERVRKARPVMIWILRPSRSAVLPKKSMNEPLERLRMC